MLAACLLAPWQHPAACTTFCLSDGTNVVFGRNYDFEIGDGMIFVNKRGVSKVSRLAGARVDASTGRGASRGGEKAASWVSRYASVTFNQFGREFPTGGMNEKGLVVELMWLDEAKYPSRDGRPTVGVLEWIQYQLDTRASVEELVAHVDDVRIRGSVPLHYLVADRTSATATIEFLDGRLNVHRGASLPVPVLTNDTYDRSVSSLGSYTAFGGSAAPPRGPGSLARFARAASMVKIFAGARATSISRYAFDVLASVAQGDHTRWSIVYDLTALEVQFRTWSHPEIRKVRLSAFDASCGSPVKVLDVNAALAGDVTTRFTDYTRQANLDLIAGSYRGVSFLSDTPRSEIEATASHPESMSCAKTD